MKALLVLLATLVALTASPALAQTTSDTGLAGKSKSVALAADDQAVTATGVGVILLTSDAASASDRTFTMTASTLVGHRVTLIWDDTDAGELADTSTTKINGAWTPSRYDTLTLVSDGTNWIETSRGTTTGLEEIALADGHILVGNSSGLAADVAVSGAVAITNAGVTSLAGFTHTAESISLIEKMAVVTWAFGTDGGAQATTGLGVTLPDNAIVTKVIEDITTHCASAGNGATIKLVLPTDGDLSADQTCDGSNVGVASVLPSGTPVKLTGARELSITIGTEAATAGVARWFVYYVQSI